MPYQGPASNKALEDFYAKSTAMKALVDRHGKIPQHYWVNRYGFAINVATIAVNPGKRRAGKKKYKYLGFTFDEKFPKKLNTGRVLYEDKKKLPKVPKN